MISYGLIQNPDRGRWRVVWNDGRGRGGCSEPMAQAAAEKRKEEMLAFRASRLKSGGKVWVEEIPLLDTVMPWSEH